VRYLAEGAGQRHPPLQLVKDLFLQGVQLPGVHASSLQLIAFAVHEVVVDADQRFVMVLG